MAFDEETFHPANSGLPAAGGVAWMVAIHGRRFIHRPVAQTGVSSALVEYDRALGVGDSGVRQSEWLDVFRIGIPVGDCGGSRVFPDVGEGEGARASSSGPGGFRHVYDGPWMASGGWWQYSIGLGRSVHGIACSGLLYFLPEATRSGQ